MFDDARWGEDPRDRVDDHDKDLDHDCRVAGLVMILERLSPSVSAIVGAAARIRAMSSRDI